MVPVLAQIFVLVGPLITQLVVNGPNFGMFDFDDIVFDFLKSFGNRATDYEIALRQLQRTALRGLLLLIPIFLITHFSAKKNVLKESIVLDLCVSVGCQFFLLSPLFLLTMYNFTGFTRTLALIVFFLSAVITLISMFFSCRHLGGFAFLVQLGGIIIGFLLTVYLTPLIGVGTVIFGDLFLIFSLILMGAGSGSCSVITVYIV